MKRLILLATMMVAVLASCEKHEIQNEVINEIGFTSNVGKQTKAIVDNSTYLRTQTFGAYAYSHQVGTGASGADKVATVMPNVEISDATPNDNAPTWKATAAHGSFYWPNDSRTTMNFYVYSPYLNSDANNTNKNSTSQGEDKHINGTISHSEGTGFSLSGYRHDNMYVDFMVGSPVYDAKYNVIASNGTVPVVFNHQLTQLVFKVKTSLAYSGITFTVNSITLNKINNVGTYTNSNLTYTNANTKGQWANGVWNPTSETTTYNVFPATGESAAVVGFDDPQTQAVEENTLTTTAMTVIPQNLVYNRTPTGSEQSFTINYTIAGTNVANETVERTVEFATAADQLWGVNKKIIYTITIGLNEIKFNPSVAAWTEETAGTTIKQ